MKERPRIYYTESQKALMWKRWKQGDSLQMIAQMFGRNHSSIQGILAQTGGIRPAQRCHSKLALTLAEREEISRQMVAGQSIHSVAGQEGYLANRADQDAWDRARRPKPCKLTENRMLANCSRPGCPHPKHDELIYKSTFEAVIFR